MVVVIALDAVVAREVALQRGEHRHSQLISVLSNLTKERRQGLTLRLAAVDHEAVLDQRLQGLALLVAEASVVVRPVQQRGDIGRDPQLRVREGVHEEHLVAIRERHLHVEHGRLHDDPYGSHRTSTLRRTRT